MSVAKAGAQGWTPSVSVKPIARKEQTVADVIAVLQTLPPSTKVQVAGGPVVKVHFPKGQEDTINPIVLLMCLGDLNV